MAIFRDARVVISNHWDWVFWGTPSPGVAFSFRKKIQQLLAAGAILIRGKACPFVSARTLS